MCVCYFTIPAVIAVVVASVDFSQQSTGCGFNDSCAGGDYKGIYYLAVVWVALQGDEDME